MDGEGTKEDDSRAGGMAAGVGGGGGMDGVRGEGGLFRAVGVVKGDPVTRKARSKARCVRMSVESTFWAGTQCPRFKLRRCFSTPSMYFVTMFIIDAPRACSVRLADSFLTSPLLRPEDRP